MIGGGEWVEALHDQPHVVDEACGERTEPRCGRRLSHDGYGSAPTVAAALHWGRRVGYIAQARGGSAGQVPQARPRPTEVTMLRMRIRLPFIVLALAVLLVAHQLVYIATYGLRGIERALASVGHDTYWFVMGSAVSLAILVGLALSLRRWLALRAELRRTGTRRLPTTIGLARVRVTVVELVPRLSLVALALFFAQENIEHFLLHGGHVPGLATLIGPDYVGSVPIFLVVSIVVACIAAILRLGLAALADLVNQSSRRRPDRDMPRPAGGRVPVHLRARSTPNLGRAPPAPA